MKGKIILILIILVLIVISKIVFSNSTDNIIEMYSKAKELKEYSFEEAEEIYMKLIKKYPETKYATIAFEDLVIMYDDVMDYTALERIYEDLKESKLKISALSYALIGKDYYFMEKFSEAYDILYSIQDADLTEEYKKGRLMYLALSLIALKRYDEIDFYRDSYYHISSTDYLIDYVIGGQFFIIDEWALANKHWKIYWNGELAKAQVSEFSLKNMLNIQLVLINTKQYTVSFEISSSLKEKIPSESAKYDTIMYGYATSAYHLGYYKLAKESCEYIIKNSTSLDFIKTAETCLDRIKSIE